MFQNFEDAIRAIDNRPPAAAAFMIAVLERVNGSHERFETALSAIERSLERSVGSLAELKNSGDEDGMWTRQHAERQKVLDAVRARESVHHVNWSRNEGITIPGALEDNHTSFHNLWNTLTAVSDLVAIPPLDRSIFPKVQTEHLEHVGEW
jgi:hypothetical protein